MAGGEETVVRLLSQALVMAVTIPSVAPEVMMSRHSTTPSAAESAELAAEPAREVSMRRMARSHSSFDDMPVSVSGLDGLVQSNGVISAAAAADEQKRRRTESATGKPALASRY